MKTWTARGNVLLLALCQALAVTGTSVLVATSALVGYALAPDKALATLPIAMQLLATTLVTMPASLAMRRFGRRAGFIGGAVVGSAGAATAAFAIIQANFVLFCLGCVLLGVYNAVTLYYRFAAADIATPSSRNQAVSMVLAGGVLAAVAGPQLATLSKDWFAPIAFAGSYAALAVLPLVGILLVSLVRIPPAPPSGDCARPLKEIVRQPEFLVALIAGTVGYAAMSLVMTATPLAMTDCALPFSDAAFVIQWHILGMFVPSFFTGRIVDRFGVANVMLAGVVLMCLCVAVNLSGTDLVNFWVALVLLGVGWNFLYIGSTLLLTRLYSPGERAKAQGLNEFVVFGTVALASASSGALQHLVGWQAVNWAVIPPLLVAGAAVMALKMRRPIPA